MANPKPVVQVSARHLHLSQDVVDILFGKGHMLEPASGGPAKGQFLSSDRVSIEAPKKSMDRIAIMGPCRNFNQFEISATDARMLGIDAPIRMSGDIEGTPGIKIIGPVGSVELDKGVIVAKRHVHLGKPAAERMGINDGDVLQVKVETEERTLIFDDVIARVGGSGDTDGMMHIDTDEGNACGMGKEARGEILLEK
ncbi:MAG: phosphate propanoyltransferase [Clostridia bacterium]|nr:phosphate propanoyltransferase [Clostridia bacterium]